MTWTYNVVEATGTGVSDGTLTIVDERGGELTQVDVDAVVKLHDELPEFKALHTLIIGNEFTSVEASMSLVGTSIKTLRLLEGNNIRANSVAYNLVIPEDRSVPLNGWVVDGWKVVLEPDL